MKQESTMSSPTVSKPEVVPTQYLSSLIRSPLRNKQFSQCQSKRFSRVSCKNVNQTNRGLLER